MDYFQYCDGLLLGEDVSLTDIARDVGTPFYAYSNATFERHYNTFSQAFDGMDTLVCYSVKANSNIAVVRTLAHLGAGADVVSGAGAGGYSGTGGQGVLGQSGPAAGGNGSGGGGGAGGCSQSPLSGGGGGGVGIQGEGPSGQGGAAGVNGGEGGSGGTDGSGNYPQNGGVHGGGGGYWAGGGVGAVRIIWPGTDRQFPSTETADW